MLGGLADLCNLLESDARLTRREGRPRCALGTIVFSLVYNAYWGMSARRFEPQLESAVELGYLRFPPSPCPETCRVPSFNTVLRYLRSSWMTSILLELVTVSATPVRSIETEFAVDGTGWGVRLYERWVDHRLDHENIRQGWVKLHLISGVATNIVAGAVVSPSSHHDNPYFRVLVANAVQRFDIVKVMADMAYSSRANHQLALDLGFELFVP